MENMKIENIDIFPENLVWKLNITKS